MRIQLSDHFNYGRLVRFVMPSIIMMIFTSVYTVIDGLFVSNFVGKTPFSALNLIYPVIMAFSAVGFMLGTGGCAVVAKTLGEGRAELANKYFTMIVCVATVTGAGFSVIGIIFIRKISVMLGATGDMLEYCVEYGSILFAALTPFMLQIIFQSFFIAAEKPALSLKISIFAGITNIVLDFVFVVVLEMGLKGAAVATAISQLVGGGIPIVYFSGKNSSLLRFTKTRLYGGILFRTVTNGSSEMMTNLSASVVNILYNFQLMKLAGENGIAAYGVLMYINFIFTAAFIGYSIGSAPIVSYSYGAENREELKNLFQKSLVVIAISGIAMTAAAELLSEPLSRIFVGYDAELFEMTRRGFRLYSASFLICGFNIFSSGFFTALNNGAVSAAISFLRTLVFQIASVAVLPILLGLDGIWLAVVAAELMALAVTVVFFAKMRNRYHYI